MEVIIDTNILFSAFYSKISIANLLILYGIEEKIELFAPNHVKEELIRNLKKKLEYTNKEVETAIETLPIEWISEEYYSDFLKIAEEKISHKNDAHILATAIAFGYDIVSNDEHLLSLTNEKLKVWKLKELIEKIESLEER